MLIVISVHVLNSQKLYRSKFCSYDTEYQFLNLFVRFGIPFNSVCKIWNSNIKLCLYDLEFKFQILFVGFEILI